MRGRKTEEKVYLELKNKIKQGILKEQTKLVELDLAEELNVSRSPVRGALQRLGTEGYVRLIPQKGAFVAPQKMNGKSYVDQLQVFELLLIQALFQLENKPLDWSVEKIQPQLKNLSQIVTKGKDLVKAQEEAIELLASSLSWHKNNYYRHLLIDLCRQILKIDGLVMDLTEWEVLDLFLNHFSRSLSCIENKQFPQARRELRIWLNELTLAVIDQQDLRNLAKYQDN